jgi:alginate O-acetyltransferase complex protein AlgJ
MTPSSIFDSEDRRRRADLAVVVLFLAAVTLPGIGLLLGVDRATVSEIERRELAKLPEPPARLAALPDWAAGLQRYFEDHFALRDRFLHWQASLLWYALRTTASATAIAGKHGWLFYADDGGLEDYVGARPFTEEELDQWQQTIERTDAWLRQRGIHYLFVIAPDKHAVYPEKMPDTLRRMHAASRADQLIARLRARGSTVPVLDLRPVLFAAKASGPLYHLYDTHWNDRGALVGYRAIAEVLRRWYPDLQPLSRADFAESREVSSGDRTTLLGLVDPGKATMPGLVPRRAWSWRTVAPDKPDPYEEDGWIVTEIPGSSLPRAVVFRDSFASRLIPYLSEHFRRAVYVWQKGFSPKVVKDEHPDVVIQEMVGRHFVTDWPQPNPESG